jgi:hypothetical protein
MGADTDRLSGQCPYRGGGDQKGPVLPRSANVEKIAPK